MPGGGLEFSCEKPKDQLEDLGISATSLSHAVCRIRGHFFLFLLCCRIESRGVVVNCDLGGTVSET